MRIAWSRYDATGNVFIILRAAELPRGTSPTQLASRLCDESRGIGADGLVIAAHSGSSRDVRVFNRDGSDGEFSVNGLRCLARFLADTDGARDIEARIEHRRYRAGATDDTGAWVEAPPAREMQDHCVIDGVVGTYVDVGNPHFIIFTHDDEPDPRRIGKRLCSHAAFARGANISVVRPEGRDRARVDTWERGVGMTACCGSGAVAAVIAGRQRGVLADRVEVTTRGGTLNVELTGEGTRVSGDVRRVDDGEWQPTG